MQIQLSPDLTNTLLHQGLEVLKTAKHSGACVFDIQTSGYIVSSSLLDDIKDYLYDMVFVAKFFCKTGSWLDRITLCGGRLWVWTCQHQPKETCHIVVCLNKDKGIVCFPEGFVKFSENSLCFGLVFNNL